MRALVNRKVTNKNVKSNDILAKFLYPPIFNGDLIVYSDLFVKGTTHLTNLDVSGNITSDQSIVAQKFVTGQIANIQILNKTDIGQATTTTVNSAATGTIFTYSYTPKCANSYIVVEYQTKYAFGGAGADSLTAYAIVNDGSDRTVGQTYQQWVNTQGGGTRSGTIFPIVGRYSNANKTAKNIIVKLQNDTDSDAVTVTGDDIMTFLKITEIGKSSTPS